MAITYPHMKTKDTPLQALLKSPDGIAALAYVHGTSEAQGYVLRGAGIEPFAMLDEVDVRSDLGTGAGEQRGTRELYARLGENAAMLARFAETLVEIADAGELACKPTP